MALHDYTAAEAANIGLGRLPGKIFSDNNTLVSNGDRGIVCIKMISDTTFSSLDFLHGSGWGVQLASGDDISDVVFPAGYELWHPLRASSFTVVRCNTGRHKP